MLCILCILGVLGALAETAINSMHCRNVLEKILEKIKVQKRVFRNIVTSKNFIQTYLARRKKTPNWFNIFSAFEFFSLFPHIRCDGTYISQPVLSIQSIHGKSTQDKMAKCHCGKWLCVFFSRLFLYNVICSTSRCMLFISDGDGFKWCKRKSIRDSKRCIQ